jgi:hypothetical protein
MGLFNFFKKGSATEDVGGLEVKGTAYDTTAKALPPIRGMSSPLVRHATPGTHRD